MRQLTARIEANPALQTFVLAGGVAFFALCTAAGAQIRILLPFSPVPVTGQTFFVLLAGALMGRKLGPASQGLYWLLALTVPGTTAGPLGMTAGYIIGFAAAAYIIGAIVGESRSFWRVLGAKAIGSAVIYVLGGAWLAGATGSLSIGVMKGVVPFIPGDIVKVIVAASIVAGGRAAFRQSREPKSL
ncbi:MAG TPA: biotin transporter BioY [Armatimonadota bacterium]|nr:biotin transporter BioY [Armatimonadota bacterium]